MKHHRSAHRRGKTPPDPVTIALRHAGSIGTLETLAGIPTTEDERRAFWLLYANLPGAASLDAGVAELKRRIVTAGVTIRTVEFLQRLQRRAGTYQDPDNIKYWDTIVRIAEAQRTVLPPSRPPPKPTHRVPSFEPDNPLSV